MERQTLFGHDLRLEDRAGGADLIARKKGDLAMATGNDNIVQALIMRLKIRKGELARLGWPDYGSRLHELIGEPNNNRTHVKLMGFARAAIERDPRVEEISSVQAYVIPGERSTVRLSMDIRLIDEDIPLNLIYTMDLEKS